MKKTPAQRAALAALIHIDPNRATCSEEVRAALLSIHVYLDTLVRPLIRKAAGEDDEPILVKHADDVIANDRRAAEVAQVVDIVPFTLDGEAWQARVGKGPGSVVLSATWNSRGAAVAGAQVEVRRLAARGVRFELSAKTEGA